VLHARRRILQRNVTAHPTAAWTAQQIVEAFPWDTAPRYLLHDRDGLFVNAIVSRRVASLGITDRRTAPRAPWQNLYVERLIGSMRRECLDHIIVLHERHLRRVLAAYIAYDERARTHLSLHKDAPVTRPVQPCHGARRGPRPSRRSSSSARTTRGLTEAYEDRRRRTGFARAAGAPRAGCPSALGPSPQDHVVEDICSGLNGGRSGCVARVRPQ
jgi:transposase InsO family protein